MRRLERVLIFWAYSLRKTADFAVTVSPICHKCPTHLRSHSHIPIMFYFTLHVCAEIFHTMNIGVLVLVLPHSTHNFHGNHTLILFPNVLQIVICSVCSQMQLLGTLINFTLLWQKAFLTWNCQTHCRLQKQVHKMVIMNFAVDSLAWVSNLHLSLVIYIATQSQRQTSQSLSTNKTGGPTTPEMLPIFKQKGKIY